MDMRPDIDVAARQRSRNFGIASRTVSACQHAGGFDSNAVHDPPPTGMRDGEAAARRHDDDGRAVGEAQKRSNAGGIDHHGISPTSSLGLGALYLCR